MATNINPNRGAVLLVGHAPSVVQTMNANSSSAPGFLAPLSEPLFDDPLADFLHGFFVGLTGLDGTMVRPRWQPEPPNMPDFTDNWLAFGINRIQEDDFAYQGEDPHDRQQDVVERDQILTVLCSFYGPQGMRIAHRMSVGVQLAQNRTYLASQQITVIDVQDAFNIPALLKEKWVPRVDRSMRLRRRAGWTFGIRTVESAQAQLDNEVYITPIVVTPPTP